MTGNLLTFPQLVSLNSVKGLFVIHEHEVQFFIVFNSLFAQFSERKIASVHPLPFLKPICASLSRGSTLYRVRCLKIFANILPVWLRRDLPRYVLQSFLLPFFFQIDTTTAHCQSSGTFLCPCYLEYCGQPSGSCFSTCQDSFRCNAINSRCFVLLAGLQCSLYL